MSVKVGRELKKESPWYRPRFLNKFGNRREETSQSGKPVQILRMYEETQLLELDHDVLYSVLCHPAADNKSVALISIVGAYRTGKSFLLNFILRYLENKGYEDQSWIGDYDKKLEGFDWSGGDDTQTTGIWMWSKPLIVKKDGKEVAVFLVDTQGHFDLDDKQQSEITVIMSMLLSSVTVYNIGKRIQKPDLAFLELCIQYSAETNHGKDMCPLQALTFLIRDWMDEESCPYGEEGGEMYLVKRIPFSKDSTVESSLSRMLNRLYSNFDSVKCYLMPPPGRDVERRKYGGELACIDNRDGFIERLKEFCDRIANPNNLILKKGLTGHRLVTLLIGNFTKMKENKSGVLDNKSYVDLRQDIAASEAFYTTVRKIQKKMDEALKVRLSPEQFKKRCDKVWNDARAEFRKKIEFLGEAGVKLQEERLEKHVALNFTRCKMTIEIAKIVHEHIVEIAIRFVKVYKEEMKEAMKDVSVQDWESQLNSGHKDNFQRAKKAFEVYSTKPKYKEGLELLTAGILCAQEFMKLGGSLKKVKTDDKLFEFKRKVFKRLNTYSEEIQAVFYGKHLEKVMEVKKDTYTKEASKLERSLGKTEAIFAQEVGEMVDIAFKLLKKRDNSLEPFRAQALQLDLKLRKLHYLTTISENIDGAYVLPDVLDELHSKILKSLLPIFGEDDPVFCTHRDNVKQELDQMMKDFKMWNEENKSTFKRVIGKFKDVLGISGVPGDSAIRPLIADIAIVTTVGAAAVTGAGVVVLGGVLIGGAAGSVVLGITLVKKKDGIKYIEEQMKRLEEGKLPELDEEDQNERNEYQLTSL